MRGRLSTFILAFGLILATAMSGAFAVPRTAIEDQTPAAFVLQVQTGPNGIGDPQRCMTIRKCQFQRGGSFRGCISTYSCRVCRFVEARCEISGRTQNCREMRCTWGG